MNSYCCYLRKSTNRQENSFDSQKDVIDSFIASNGGDIVHIFKEEGTGSDDTRPVLQQAVEYCVSNGSMLLVSHCDRLSRNLYTVARLNQLKGLTIVVAELGTVQASTLMLNLRSVIASEERAAIRRRIKDTFATLKAQGRTFGRSDFGLKEGCKGRSSYKRKCDEFAALLMPRIKALKLAGICSYTAISKHLNLAGFTTVNGKRFYPTTVKNLLLTYS